MQSNSQATRSTLRTSSGWEAEAVLRSRTRWAVRTVIPRPPLVGEAGIRLSGRLNYVINYGIYI